MLVPKVSASHHSFKRTDANAYSFFFFVGHPTSLDEYYSDLSSQALLLPPTSHVRIQLEEARMEVLRWLGGPAPAPATSKSMSFD